MDEFVQRIKSLFVRQSSEPIRLRDSYRTTKKLISSKLKFQFASVTYSFFEFEEILIIIKFFIKIELWIQFIRSHRQL